MGYLTSHDDMKDAGLLLDPDHVGGGAHDRTKVHRGERGVAQHRARAVVLGSTLQQHWPKIWNRLSNSNNNT